MRGGKRIALSIAAALALPALGVAIYFMPASALSVVGIVVIAIPCAVIGYTTYIELGD